MSSFFFPPSPPLPTSRSFPFPLEVGTSQLRLEGLGERSSSPSGSGQSPAAKRILTHFSPNFVPFEYLMQLSDTLSHIIISHKTDTDGPITKAVSKLYNSNFNLPSFCDQVVLCPEQLVHWDTKKGLWALIIFIKFVIGCILFWSLVFWIILYSFESSAYKKLQNNNGLNMLPWGLPLSTLNQDDLLNI